MDYVSFYDSPIGKITLISDGENLTGVWLKGQRTEDFLEKKDIKKEEVPVLFETKKWLDIYFEGREPQFMPALKAEGSAFEKRVLKRLQEIPFGTTTTYGDIAKKIAQEMGKEKMSAQAVGGAIGRNPIAIIIPCHRVVGRDATLTGYAGGLDKKEYLLKNEHVSMQYKNGICVIL